MVVVTDNRAYSRLIAATMVKVTRKQKSLVRMPSLTELDDLGLHQLEVFQDGISIYQRVSSTIGSQSGANKQQRGITWFDRLWKTGTGTHAERDTRFVVAAYRCS
jgi:hypothetical protein